MFENLFSPIRVRGLKLPNRIVMTAMGTHFADEDSYITQQLIDFQVERAKGGVGLSFLECCSVNEAACVRKQPSISDDRYLPGHKALVQARGRRHHTGRHC